MAKISIVGYECEVAHIGEFAKGPDGACAFCEGDPCNEYPEQHPNAAINKYVADGKFYDTCPCCDGRAS